MTPNKRKKWILVLICSICIILFGALGLPGGIGKLGKALTDEIKNYISYRNSLIENQNQNGTLSGENNLHGDDGNGNTTPVHIPQIRRLSNVWVLEVNEDAALVYMSGEKIEYPLDECDLPLNTFVDVELTDGVITEAFSKEQAYCDRVLAADENWILLENRGKVKLGEECAGIRLMPELEVCEATQIPIGYSFTDFWEKDGEIYAYAVARQEPMEEIRVLIKNSGFEDIFHKEITLTADSDVQVQNENGTSAYFVKKGEEMTFSGDTAPGTQITITPVNATGKIYLPSVKRSVEHLGYRGKMILTFEEKGIVAVNELPLEEYLYSVVPSEMPAGYPPEALQAQAICARTYAYGKMQEAGYPQYGAHVDDSTGYQVYNNINEQDATNEAVRATLGQMLYTAEGKLADTYYFSTSCGFGTDKAIWGGTGSEEKSDQEVKKNQTDPYYDSYFDEATFREAILSINENDFDVAEPWYRWTYTVESIDADGLYDRITARALAQPEQILFENQGTYISAKIPKFKKIKNIKVEKRGAGGVAHELVIETDKGNIKVVCEYNIRYCLADGVTKVRKNDGEYVEMPKLLPSGFFVIDLDFKKKNVVGYSISGGGYGHGVGMSQNGAKNMALAGCDTEQILDFFYRDCATETSKTTSKNKHAK